MKFLLNWLLNHFLFAGTLMFAAGAVADAGGGGDAGAGDSGGGDAGDAGDAGAGGDAGSGGDESAAGDGGESFDDDAAAGGEQKPAAQSRQQDDPDTAEFKGAVSNRLRALTKKAPELAAVFQKHPEIQAQIEATMRRDAAYRDAGMTVAEVRTLRETFPNGLQDVQVLQDDVKSLQELDRNFYAKDAEGSYSGHKQLLENMFNDDREATVALFKQMPKEWARQDPESYNEVMGKIVGATFTRRGIPEYLGELIGAAEEAKDAGLVQGLTKLLNWVKGYTTEKPQPSADQLKLENDRKAFDKQKTESQKVEHQKFTQTFFSESKKLQLDAIAKHPTMMKLQKQQGITPQKRAEIAEKVRIKVADFLKNSPSFMRKLEPAFKAHNLTETQAIQKAAWSQQWLLNSMIRKVLQVETPALISNNRAAQRRPAGTSQQKAAPTAGASKDKPTKPFKVGGQWYKPDGSRFSTAEIMRGDHQK